MRRRGLVFAAIGVEKYYSDANNTRNVNPNNYLLCCRKSSSGDEPIPSKLIGNVTSRGIGKATQNAAYMRVV